MRGLPATARVEGFCTLSIACSLPVARTPNRPRALGRIGSEPGLEFPSCNRVMAG
jgi:hypothetical protein